MKQLILSWKCIRFDAHMEFCLFLCVNIFNCDQAGIECNGTLFTTLNTF